MFYFRDSKNPSSIIKDIFNSISLYFWEKISLLTNIRNKCIIRKINLHFLTAWKIAKFFLQRLVIFNMIPDSFLVEKWGMCTEVRRQKYFLQNILIETSNVSFKKF